MRLGTKENLYIRRKKANTNIRVPRLYSPSRLSTVSMAFHLREGNDDEGNH
jgi:hypothetical protein